MATWCCCGNCAVMDTFRERKCCTELEECQQRFEDSINLYGNEDAFTCIVQHPGFINNCLLWEVLENAWLAYKQHYGNQAYVNNNDHKRWRHVAYRQLARFLHGVVGKDNRFVLPACAVTAIRQTFQKPEDEQFVGFQE